MQQAWHIDSPLPNVYVNILYLETGQRMTQFMVPRMVGGTEENVPDGKTFLPLGEKGIGAPILDQEWRDYLRKR